MSIVRPYIPTVGQLYRPDKRTWTEGGDYNYRNQAHELRLFYNSPTVEEIDAVTNGPVSFAVYLYQDVIYFCFNLFDIWEDCPFSIYLLPEDQRGVPPTEDDNADPRASLTIFLIDACTGLLAARRAVKLSAPFTRALHAAIVTQAARPFPALPEYKRQIQRMHARYKPVDIATRLALVRCEGCGQ